MAQAQKKSRHSEGGDVVRPKILRIGVILGDKIVEERLVRDRLYDAACFFTSNADTGKRGEYKEPHEELSIRNFAISLHARAAAFAHSR